MSEAFNPAEFAGVFADMMRELGSDEGDAAVLVAITGFAVRAVPGADHAGITIWRGPKRVITVAATSDLVNTVDQIQYQLGAGPCLDAVVQRTTFKVRDLRTELRWPDFGTRAVETGIVSMLSLCLYSESDRGMTVGLNMYSHTVNAFDDHSQAMAVLLATHGARALGAAGAPTSAADVTEDLKDSHDFGIAIGILMAQYNLTRDEAFELLRFISQRTHRNVGDIGTNLANSGAVSDVPTKRSVD